MAENDSSPQKLDELMVRAKDYARREPTTAMISAFGIGFLLNMLPLGAIAAGIVGLAASAVRPVLLFLGIVKACEYCRVQTATPASHE